MNLVLARTQVGFRARRNEAMILLRVVVSETLQYHGPSKEMLYLGRRLCVSWKELVIARFDD